MGFCVQFRGEGLKLTEAGGILKMTHCREPFWGTIWQESDIDQERGNGLQSGI